MSGHSLRINSYSAYSSPSSSAEVDFVEEYRLRLGKQNAGEPDPLLLARGEHPGPVLGLVESMAEVSQRHLIQHVLQFGIGNVAGGAG